MLLVRPRNCEQALRRGVIARMIALTSLESRPELAAIATAGNNSSRDYSSSDCGSNALQHGPELLPPDCALFSLAAMRRLLERGSDAFWPDSLPTLTTAHAVPIAQDPRRDAVFAVALVTLLAPCVAIAWTWMFPILAVVRDLLGERRLLPPLHRTSFVDLLPITSLAAMLLAAARSARELTRQVFALWHLALPPQLFHHSLGDDARGEIVQAIRDDFASSLLRPAALEHLIRAQLLPLPLCRLVAAYLPAIERQLTMFDLAPFGVFGAEGRLDCALIRNSCCECIDRGVLPREVEQQIEPWL